MFVAVFTAKFVNDVYGRPLTCVIGMVNERNWNTQKAVAAHSNIKWFWTTLSIWARRARQDDFRQSGPKTPTHKLGEIKWKGKEWNQTNSWIWCCTFI